MATTKNGQNNQKKNNNDKGFAHDWIDVPLAAWVMDLGAFAIPAASVAELTVTAQQLANRQLVDPTEGEERTKARMVGAADLCARAIEHNATLLAPQAAGRHRRRRLVSQLASAMAMVAVRARSPEPEVAEDALQLQAAVFGAALDPSQMDARTLTLRLKGIGDRLAQQPDLRKRMEACVPKAQLDRLFAEGREWGKEIGADADAAPALDLRALRAHIRQRMAEYVTNVLATVNGDDPATSARAAKALMPLTELREDLRVRQVRRARMKSGSAEVTDDEDELVEPEDADDVVALPPTTPAATEPVTDDDG